MPGPETLAAVPARYTWKQVSACVAAEHARNRSMRQIAEDINKHAGPGVVNITHRTVQRILQGHEPQNAKVRATLHLPVLAPVPVCPACGIVHTKACPNRPKAPRKPRTDWKGRALRAEAGLRRVTGV